MVRECGRMTAAVPDAAYGHSQVKAGTLVLLHHSLVHFSKANTSDKSRHAYSIHVVEGKDGYKYLEDNWLQRPVDTPFHELP